MQQHKCKHSNSATKNPDPDTGKYIKKQNNKNENNFKVLLFQPNHQKILQKAVGRFGYGIQFKKREKRKQNFFFYEFRCFCCFRFTGN